MPIGRLSYHRCMTADARHLRVLLAIAAEGTITRAAASLHLSQPAASRLLQQLEAHLGRRLVDRSTHHLRLTDDGERYVLRSAAAIRALDAVLDPAMLGHRPLRVGYAWSALGGPTTSLLTGWRREHPESPVELRRIDDRLAGLLRGDVDAAIVRDLEPGSDLRRAVIARESRVAALPADHPLAGRGTLTLADLVDETLVVNSTSGTTAPTLWPPEAAPTRLLDVRNTDDWLFTIAAGDGVGVSSRATSEVHASPDVRYVPLLDVPEIVVELAWLTPTTHPLIPALAAFWAERLRGRA